MTSLTNVNFMSQDRFNTIGETSNSEMYLVEGGFFPSDKYEDLTLGASGTEYTAPADGWFSLFKKISANQYFVFTNTSKNYRVSFAPSSTNSIMGVVPVQKGDTVKCEYTASGATEYFRFVYA